MTCDDVTRDLDAYVDQELDPAQATAVGDHLGTCVSCRQRRNDREALGRLLRTAPYHVAPDRLRTNVVTLTRPVSRIPRGALAAAAALTLAVGAWWAMHDARSAPIADSIVAEVVSDHVRSLMADHLFDVQSTDMHTVKPWFLGKLDFSPPVADLASTGFPLVGGRLDYLAGRPVAALVYRRQQHSINVFIAPDSGNASEGDRAASVRGFHVRHFVHDAMSFWAVSDLNDAELDEFVRALQSS
jgi:anti-sigma factor RsiW